MTRSPGSLKHRIHSPGKQSPGLFSDPPHIQKARNQSGRLPQRQTEQRLQRQAGLNGRVGERGRTAPLPTRPGQPYRLRVKPPSHTGRHVLPGNGSTTIRAASGRPSPLGSNQWRRNGSTRTPVRRAAGRRCRFAHALRPTPWSHTGNPS